jgi:hypothetical protein
MGNNGSFPGSKQPGLEADYSPPYSAEVKECVELSFRSQYAFMAWCSVKKSTGTILPLPFTEVQHQVKGNRLKIIYASSTIHLRLILSSFLLPDVFPRIFSFFPST